MGYSFVNWWDIANYSGVDVDKTGVGEHVTSETFKDFGFDFEGG